MSDLFNMFSGFPHVAELEFHLFSFHIPLYVCTTFCWSIHLPIDTQVAFFFWLLWIMLLTWVSLLSVILDIYSEVKLLDQMVTLSFWGTAILISMGVYRFTFLPAMYKDSNFSTSHQPLLFSFLIVAILVGVKANIFKIYKCHSLAVLQIWKCYSPSLPESCQLRVRIVECYGP